MIKSTLASYLALVSGVLAQRTLIVYNGCPFTIWPVMFTGSGARPNYPTGWEAAAYTSVTFQCRRDCDFSRNSGPNSCIDGGCNGGLECDGIVPPTPLAELTLGTNGLDHYDVYFVDGYNLPFAIMNTVGCGIVDCLVDLGPNCPPHLIGPFDSADFPVGCKSACEANPDGQPTNSPNCCTVSTTPPATCPSSGVAPYSYFKSNCPNSYCYAFDESSGTALWICPSNRDAVYAIMFCPSPSEVCDENGSGGKGHRSNWFMVLLVLLLCSIIVRELVPIK